MKQRTRQMRLGGIAALVAGVWLFTTGAVVHAASGDAEGRSSGRARASNNTYIVQLAEQPVSAYRGGVRGYAATQPRRGEKVDPDDTGVASYKGYLESRHDAVLASVGGGRKLHTYGYVFNGFAAELTDAQAQKLAQMPGVLAVGKDELRQLTTATTPTFLGLSGRNGFWNTTRAKGENVVIGMVDSGVWPEHPSFSDRDDDDGHDRNGERGHRGRDQEFHHLRGWKGKCITGDSFRRSDCNNKLIGARFYNAGFGGNAGVTALFPFEFNSPRDWGGHGTHTASTAGGNANVQATGAAAAFGRISGMAPRARIAVYKVCWADEATGGGCFGSDSVAAIDQAVADGVDVINFSISGTSTNFRDPVEIAFLNAADAGVFVAASAGNAGPTVSTVAHPSPWITTVAAGTHNRNGEGSALLGNGASFAGASYATAVGPLPLIDAAAAGLAGANAAAVALCFAAADNAGVAVLDPAQVAGKIVVCNRGGNALVNKAQAVKDAGGLGMILVNTPTSNTTTLAILHVVPAVHLPVAAFADIKAYAATAGATAKINAATIVLNVPAPLTASFSSRGPLRAGIGDLLKPDLIAPGQDILAGVAPPGNNGKLFDLFSGTSMSSPHVAGLGALLKELHPDWSPMAIKSALMTSAGNVLDGPDTNPLVIFRQGAGHVRPLNAADPGLVFDSNLDDWLGFLCGTQLPTSFCTSAGVPVLDPSNLNVASIAIGDMAGIQTVKRSVTNVGGNPATYTASFTGMAGFNVVVSPSQLHIGRGKTKNFTVTFTRTAANLNAYTGGQLTLSDGLHNVRVPMVVQPVALAAPLEVSGSYKVTFGYDGPFTATGRGLVPATTAAGAVATGGSVDIPVTIPAGTTYARFSLFDSEVSQASDLDLEVRLGTTLVGSSGSGTSAEEVNLANPVAGVYTVRVLGFAVPVGSANFKLFSWALGATGTGNMVVTAPAAAVTGQSGAIGITTSGLAAGTKYLGSVVYGGAAGLPTQTVVRIDQP